MKKKNLSNIINFIGIPSSEHLLHYVWKKIATKRKYARSGIDLNSISIRKAHPLGTKRYVITLNYKLGNQNKALQVEGDDLYKLVDVMDAKMSSVLSKK